MGKPRYVNASKLMITADGGGSNGSRVRLWKLELQKLADEINYAQSMFPISLLVPASGIKLNIVFSVISA